MDLVPKFANRPILMQRSDGGPQAFQSIIRQLLTESEAEVAEWREKIATAVTPNGQVISDVIPEVELIIGQQPCLLYTSPSPRDVEESRMPSSA